MIPFGDKTGGMAMSASPQAAVATLMRSKGDSPEKIRAAAAQFEAVFVTQMFQAMRKTVPQDGMFSGGNAGKMHQDMLDTEYAKSMAMSGGMGLGKMIARELGGEAAANAIPATGDITTTPFANRQGLTMGGQPTFSGVPLVDGRVHTPTDPSKLCAPEDMRDGFCWPAPGRITSGFGVRRDPITGDAGSFHSGIDLATPGGSAVRALAPGRVVESGRRGGYGNVVVVEHDGGFQSLYAHNTEVLLPVGARVAAGDPVAISGSTGRSTGPHVHFEVRRGGVPVDPREFVRGGP